MKRISASRVLRLSAKLATGTLAGRLIYLAALPLITRLYPPSTFGIFALIIALGTFATALGTLKLDVAVMTLKGSVESGRVTAALLRTSVLLPLAAFLLLSVPAAIFGLPFALETSPSMFLAFVTLVGITGAVSVTLRAWAIRVGAFSAVAYSSGFRVALQAVLAILFGILPANTEWTGGYFLAASVAISDCLAIAILMQAAGTRRRRQFAGVGRQAMLAALHKNRRISSAVSTSQMFNQFAAQLPNVWISWIFGPALAGLFGFAQRVVFLPINIITGSVGTILINTISEKYNRGENVGPLVIKQLAFASASGLAVFVPVALISYFHVEWLFGQEWAASGPVVAIMCILGFANMLITTNLYLPPLLGMKNFLFWSSSLRLALQIVAALLTWVLELTLHEALVTYALLELLFSAIQSASILKTGRIANAK